MPDAVEFRYPSFVRKIIIIVGGFGSGKTEVSVNLAKFMASTQDSPVTIVDLDLVNPYFRSREAVGELEALGVRAIAPRGDHFHADLPILLPEVKGVIEDPRGVLILDVGGDAQGARALGSLSAEFKNDAYEMLMVLNSRRPATENVETSLKTMERIERTSKLKFSGLIANSHLIEETDFDVVVEGYRLGVEISAGTGLPLLFISVKENILNKIDVKTFECPVLPLTRTMLKPWERRNG